MEDKINITIFTLEGKKINLFVDKNILAGPEPLRSETYDESIPNKNKIINLKSIISSDEGIPIEQQKLIFNGKVLVDFKTLEEQSIKNNDRIYLVLRLGGPSLEGNVEYTIPHNSDGNVSIKTPIKYIWKIYSDLSNSFMNILERFLKKKFGHQFQGKIILSDGIAYLENDTQYSSEILEVLHNIKIKIFKTKDLVLCATPRYDKYLNLFIPSSNLLEYDTTYCVELYSPDSDLNCFLHNFSFFFKTEKEIMSENIEIHSVFI